MAHFIKPLTHNTNKILTNILKYYIIKNKNRTQIQNGKICKCITLAAVKAFTVLFGVSPNPLNLTLKTGIKIWAGNEKY